MGAVAERLDISLEEVKAYLNANDSEEVFIETLIDAAKEAADNFLCNSFTDPEGNPQPIPTVVKMWVFRRIARYYERRTEGLTGLRDDVGSIQWGPEEYEELWALRKYPGT